MIADQLLTALQTRAESPEELLYQCVNQENLFAMIPLGTTCLHIAALYNHVELCEHLLTYHAQEAAINASDATGCTPLYYAVRNTAKQCPHANEILIRLLKAGAKKSAKTICPIVQLMREAEQEELLYLQCTLEAALIYPDTTTVDWQDQTRCLIDYIKHVIFFQKPYFPASSEEETDPLLEEANQSRRIDSGLDNLVLLPITTRITQAVDSRELDDPTDIQTVVPLYRKTHHIFSEYPTSFPFKLNAALSPIVEYEIDEIDTEITEPDNANVIPKII